MTLASQYYRPQFKNGLKITNVEGFDEISYLLFNLVI